MSMETRNLLFLRKTFSLKFIFGALLIYTACTSTASFADRTKVRKRNLKSSAFNSSDEVCETSGCVDAGSTVFKWVDPSTDSCDDFYRFACGDDYKEELLDNKPADNNYGPIGDIIDDKLKANSENDEKDPKVFKLMQSYYNACMNTAQLDKTNKNNFKDILKKLGGWPVLDGNYWDESTFDWKKLDNKLRSMGYSMNHFISFYVAFDSNNNSRRVIYLDQATLGLERKILLLGAKERIVRAYFKYMIDIAEIYGATRAQAQKELAESIFFEIQLAKISISQEEHRDLNTTYNPMSIRELHIRYPNIPWTEYVNELLAPHRKVENSETIIVVVPSYLESFSDLIAKTPKRVLANYAIWRVVMQTASRMCERVQKAESEFLSASTGTTVRTPRWKECFNQLGNNLHLALGALYVRRYFDDEEAKKNVIDIVDHLKFSFCGNITNITSEANNKYNYFG